jgi:hypothetical protein
LKGFAGQRSALGPAAHAVVIGVVASAIVACASHEPRARDPSAPPDARLRARVATGYDGDPAAAVHSPVVPSGVSLRTELGVEGDWRNFDVAVEYDGVVARAARGADAAGTPASRLQVPALAGLGPTVASIGWQDSTTRVTIGRQAFAPAGERFLGMNAWRPGAQSYDGFRLRSSPWPATEFSYTWAAGIVAHEAVDDTGLLPRWTGRFHLLDGTLDGGALGRLQGFVYRMAFADALRTDSAAVAGGAQSGATFGASWRREFRLGEFEPLPLGLSYASATRSGAARVPYTVRYLQFETGLGVANARLKVGRGGLERDAVAPADLRGSPLVQWYAAEGWGGRFTGARPAGSTDTYSLVQAEIAGTALEIGRHELRGPGAEAAWGAEWNTTLSRRLAGWLHLQARFASLRGVLGDDRHYSVRFEVPLR